MKITKKFFKFAVPVIGGVAAVVFVLTFMLTSFFGWQGGYNKYLENLQWLKDNAGIRMTGMTLTVADDVSFFDNGKARPNKTNFVLTGSYIVDGVREYSEPIVAEDYTLEAPSDFAESGGTVKATYEYFSEGSEAEEPTEVFEATLDVTLTALEPTSLEMVKKPYLVSYEEESKFDLKGAEFRAVLNDGTVLPVDNGKLTATDKALAATDTTAEVSYTSGEKTVKADVPITVMARGTFTNGELLSLEGVNAVVENGATLKTAQLELYGVYSSGNYVEIPEFTILNGEETAVLGNAHVLEISASADNSSHFCTVNTRVRQDVAAGSPVDNTYTFAVDSTLLHRSSLSVLYENPTDKIFALSDVLSVTVNGHGKTIPADVSVSGSSGALSVTEALLGAGENSVSVSFASEEAGEKLVLKGVRMESGSNAAPASSLGEFVRQSVEAEEPISLKAEPVVGFADTLQSSMYGYGMCTDGKYIYVGMNSEGNNDGSNIRVAQIDPVSGSVEAQTESLNIPGKKVETYTSPFFYDGNIIVCTLEGFKYIPADFKDNAEKKLQPYEGLNFEGLASTAVNNVVFNRGEEKFAVTTSEGKLYFFDKTGAKLTEGQTFASAAGGRDFRRMTGTDEYLYFSYKINNQPSPFITVYDWSGKILNKEITLTVDPEDMAQPGYDGGSSNTQAVMELNGNVYYLVTYWGNGGSYGLFRAPFIKGVSSVPTMNLGEYVGAATDAGIELDFQASQLKWYPWGQVYTGGDIFGLTTDGKYGYFAYSNISSGLMRDTIIMKFDLESGEKLGETLPQNMDTSAGGWHDHSQMFYKDGFIYVVDLYGQFYRVFADDITADNKPALEPATDMVFGGLTGRVISAHYNAVNDGYAVYTTADELAFYNGNRELVGKVTAAGSDFVDPENPGKPAVGQRFRAGLAGNADYVYVLQNEMGSLKATIHIYDWSGKLLGTTEVGNIWPGTDAADTKASRATGMMEWNGRLYFSVSDRSGTFVTISRLILDLSVFG